MVRWLPLCIFFSLAPAQTTAPLKAGLCQMAAHPDQYDGKLVEVRAMVESGIEDLPAGVVDDTCGAEFKFLTPDDAVFGRLLKNKAFRKMVKEVKHHPNVEATVTGWFHASQDPKKQPGLALQSVADVIVKPTPKL